MGPLGGLGVLGPLRQKGSELKHRQPQRSQPIMDMASHMDQASITYWYTLLEMVRAQAAGRGPDALSANHLRWLSEEEFPLTRMEGDSSKAFWRPW